MMLELPSKLDIVAAKIQRGGLEEYVKAFWNVLEPGSPFVNGWHIGALCAYAEAVIVTREIKRAVVNIPPRMLKSTIFSVAAQAYKWTKQPSHGFMAASYDQGLVERDAQRIVDVIQSPLHQALFPHVQLDGVQAMKNLRLTAGGRRHGTTPRAKGGTGWGAQTQVVDDPINVQKAVSERELTQVANWFCQTMANRIDGPPEDFVRLVVMQRLHDLDLSGVCERLGYDMFVLPMGKRDKHGRWVELLFPQLWGPEQVAKMAKELGSEQAVSAQLLQDPTPPSGGYVEEDWIQRYDSLPAADHMLRWFQIWDLNFKGNRQAQSRVAGGLFFEWDGAVWLHDYCADHLNYPDTRKRLLELDTDAGWDQAGRIYVEDAANGPAIVADFRSPDRALYRPELADRMTTMSRKMQPFAAGAVAGQKGSFGKAERIKLQSDKIRAGKLRVRRGLDEPVKELVGFPNARYDDLADIQAKALELLDARGLRQKSPLLQKILQGAKRVTIGGR